MNIPLTPLRFLRYGREQFPNKTAIVCGDERFTYAQFADRSALLAGLLVAAGAQPGDRIAFLSTNCHRLLEAYYGVLEAGCILLPLNIRLAPHELEFVLNHAEAKFLFFEKQFLPIVEKFRAAVPSLETFVLLDGQPQAEWLGGLDYDALLRTNRPFQCDISEVDEDATAELFYTSGSSDTPKGVMLSHRNVYLHALSVIVAGQTSPTMAGYTCSETVMLHTIPLFHANGWGAAHTITFVGGKHVMLHHFTPTEVFRLIEREGVWCCALVPTMANALVNSPDTTRHDLSTLRLITIGGAASSPTLVREVEAKLGCSCISGYGLTETSPAIAFSPIKPHMLLEGSERYAGQATTGFAIPGVELRVVDSSDNEVPHDGSSIGEVIVRGDGVMKGYWGRPEENLAALRGGWFHTGDAATLDENRYLMIVDRKKDIIISGGENISSLEVEKTVASHPAVFEVAVIPVQDEKWGEVPKALVVLRPGCQCSEAELLEFCRSRLSHYKCPHSAEFLPSLPKSGTGKLLKRELKEKYSRTERNVVS